MGKIQKHLLGCSMNIFLPVFLELPWSSIWFLRTTSVVIPAKAAPPCSTVKCRWEWESTSVVKMWRYPQLFRLFHLEVSNLLPTHKMYNTYICLFQCSIDVPFYMILEWLAIPTYRNSFQAVPCIRSSPAARAASWCPDEHVHILIAGERTSWLWKGLWLVLWNMNFIFPLGISSSQLTNAYFSEG